MSLLRLLETESISKHQFYFHIQATDEYIIKLHSII